MMDKSCLNCFHSGHIEIARYTNCLLYDEIYFDTEPCNNWTPEPDFDESEVDNEQ